MGQRFRRRRGLSRRDFLRQSTVAAVAGGLIAGCQDSGGRPSPNPGGGTGSAGKVSFAHGVASGDPLADRVILWTRVSPGNNGTPNSIPVQVEVYADPAAQQLVQTYSSQAQASRDYCVKLDALGLAPATTYYYRFFAEGEASALGRTRTLPQGDVDHLRLGVVSCSSLAHGYFHAYRFLAQRADLDLILHLGDYIYEYANDEYGSIRGYEPNAEIVSLSDYRQRHAQYKRDADLQELHRQHPMIAVWDDHESTNNSRRDSAQNHQPDEGDWQERKATAQRVYDEWMPIRYPEPGNVNKIWRKFSLGNLADLTMLDTRLFDRDDEIDCTSFTPVSGSIPLPICPDAIFADRERKLLGPEQMQFLLDNISGTQATWKLIGQQVMFGQLKFTGIPLSNELGAEDVFFNPDQWDGYPGERNQILDFIQGNSIDNVVVLTGDIHTSWAMDITQEPDNPLLYNPLTGAGSRGVEFVATSVTSPGLEEILPPTAAAPELVNVLRLTNPHMRYIEGTQRGYMLLDLQPDAITSEWWYVSDVTLPDSASERFAAGYRVTAGSNTVPLTGQADATPAKADAPPLAPAETESSPEATQTA